MNRNIKNLTRPLLKAIIMVFISFLFPSLSNAQNNDSVTIETYTIKSLDGTIHKIHFKHELLDSILTIYSLKDTTRIYDYWCGHKIHVLNKTFIQLIYPVRTGSDEGSEKMIILCMNKGKIYNAMNVTCSSNYNIDQEHGLYDVKVKLTGSSKTNYKLDVHVHDDVYSKRDPKSNYRYNDQTTLNFDRNQHVFYSIKKFIDSYFTIYDPISGKHYKQQFKGNYPVIILGEWQYYFIKANWYGVGNTTELEKY